MTQPGRPDILCSKSNPTTFTTLGWCATRGPPLQNRWEAGERRNEWISNLHASQIEGRVRNMSARTKITSIENISSEGIDRRTSSYQGSKRRCGQHRIRRNLGRSAYPVRGHRLILWANRRQSCQPRSVVLVDVVVGCSVLEQGQIPGLRLRQFKRAATLSKNGTLPMFEASLGIVFSMPPRRAWTYITAAKWNGIGGFSIVSPSPH